MRYFNTALGMSMLPDGDITVFTEAETASAGSRQGLDRRRQGGDRMKALTARPASMSVEQYDYLIPFTNPRARLALPSKWQSASKVGDLRGISLFCLRSVMKAGCRMSPRTCCTCC